MNSVDMLSAKHIDPEYPINLSQIYDQYAAALFGIIVRDTGNRQAAEDILCSAFHKIYNGFSSYRREEQRFFTWMLCIVRKEIQTFYQT